MNDDDDDDDDDYDDDDEDDDDDDDGNANNAYDSQFLMIVMMIWMMDIMSVLCMNLYLACCITKGGRKSTRGENRARAGNHEDVGAPSKTRQFEGRRYRVLQVRGRWIQLRETHARHGSYSHHLQLRKSIADRNYLHR